MTAVISSGHSKYVAGAIGLVDEVIQARKITDCLYNVLSRSMKVIKFHDDISKDKVTNVNTIVKFHNSQNRLADYSIHLNSVAGGTRETDIGIECLYKDDKYKQHAQDICNAISKATGLKNRGAKKRTDLGFLNGTNKPAFLLEAYFVNSVADVRKMDEAHEIEAMCEAMAKVICKQWGYKFVAKTVVTVNENTPSNWALDDWNWGIENRITDGTKPLSVSTRQELVAMLHRYYKKFN